MRPVLNILKKENAIRTEVIKNNGISTKYWYFKCFLCDNVIKAKADYIKKATGLCKACTQRKKPFESIYNSVKYEANGRAIQFLISFEEFLDFTMVKNCHYCDGKIEWKCYRDTRTTTFKYFLDRKDSKIGYVKNNIVVCCSLCNYTKSDKFSYQEFLLFGPILAKIRENREYIC